MLKLLEEIVNIDSNSYDKQGVSRVFRCLEKFFHHHGLVTKSHYVEDVEVAITVEVEPKTKVLGSVLLMGHCDTVFPTGEAARRPFKIEDNRAYGPGVADMKSGIVMNAFLLAAIAQSDEFFPIVSGLFTCDEEIGSPLSKEIIAKVARDKQFVFNSEPGRPNGNVVTGRKGGVFIEMDIQGKAAHSGANFADGISAISELAHKVIELDKLTDTDAGVTVNVGLVSGGISVNTSAPSAKASIDLRIHDLEQRESMVSKIRCVCNKSFISGALAKMDVIGEFQPFIPTPQSKKLFELYQSTLADMGYKTGEEFSGGCADSGVTSNIGAITLCATGPVGGKFHTVEEYCEIDTIVPRAQALIGTIQNLGNQDW